MIQGLLFPGRVVRIVELTDDPSDPVDEVYDEETELNAPVEPTELERCVGHVGFVLGHCRPYGMTGDSEVDPLWRVRVPRVGTDGFWTEELTDA